MLRGHEAGTFYGDIFVGTCLWGHEAGTFYGDTFVRTCLWGHEADSFCGGMKWGHVAATVVFMCHP